jgi:hypothetical protein
MGSPCQGKAHVDAIMAKWEVQPGLVTDTWESARRDLGRSPTSAVSSFVQGNSLAGCL